MSRAIEMLEHLDTYEASLLARKAAGTMSQAEYDTRCQVAKEATMKEIAALGRSTEPVEKQPKRQRRLGDGSAPAEVNAAKRTPKESWGPFEDQPAQTYKDIETARQVMVLFDVYTKENSWKRTPRATRAGGSGSMPKDDPSKYRLNWEYEKGSGEDKEVVSLRAKMLETPTDEGHTCGIFMKAGLPRAAHSPAPRRLRAARTARPGGTTRHRQPLVSRGAGVQVGAAAPCNPLPDNEAAEGVIAISQAQAAAEAAVKDWGTDTLGINLSGAKKNGSAVLEKKTSWELEAFLMLHRKITKFKAFSSSTEAPATRQHKTLANQAWDLLKELDKVAKAAAPAAADNDDSDSE